MQGGTRETWASLLLSVVKELAFLWTVNGVDGALERQDVASQGVHIDVFGREVYHFLAWTGGPRPAAAGKRVDTETTSERVEFGHLVNDEAGVNIEVDDD
jgi:hypothetical protein